MACVYLCFIRSLMCEKTELTLSLYVRLRLTSLWSPFENPQTTHTLLPVCVWEGGFVKSCLPGCISVLIGLTRLMRRTRFFGSPSSHLLLLGLGSSAYVCFCTHSRLNLSHVTIHLTGLVMSAALNFISAEAASRLINYRKWMKLWTKLNYAPGNLTFSIKFFLYVSQSSNRTSFSACFFFSGARAGLSADWLTHNKKTAEERRSTAKPACFLRSM